MFWPFLAGYSDSEGGWVIFGVGDYIEICFRLETTDPELLKHIKEELEESGYHPKFRLNKRAGEGVETFRYTKDYYGVFLERRDEVVRLAEKLLPYSRHEEKIAWMKLILEVKDEKYWANVKDSVIALREKIDKETEETVKEAEEQYKRRHGSRDWFEVHSYRKSGDDVKDHIEMSEAKPCRFCFHPKGFTLMKAYLLILAFNFLGC